jgi:hypothetical protein
LPTTGLTVDGSMILSDDALVHTPPFALIVAELEIVVKVILMAQKHNGGEINIGLKST